MSNLLKFGFNLHPHNVTKKNIRMRKWKSKIWFSHIVFDCEIFIGFDLFVRGDNMAHMRISTVFSSTFFFLLYPHSILHSFQLKLLYSVHNAGI